MAPIRKHLSNATQQSDNGHGYGNWSSLFQSLRHSPLPNMNNRSSFRGGMQVHSVPETERAVGANGQRLPWAYEYAESSHVDTREKGPFGRSTRRRTPSRSKTATPSRKEDKDSAENWRVIDDIFRRAKEDEQRQELARSASVPTGAQLNTDGQDAKSTPAGIPTEVILYGFAPGFQYAALEFYERASRGTILEDYERVPPNPRYSNTLAIRQSRGAGIKLSQEALRKKNTHRGGTHWIKITFDSAEAADLACTASPHKINGYIVHAEPYRGEGPAGGDFAIPATRQTWDDSTASPTQTSSTTIRGGSSETATSATMTTILPDPFTTHNAIFTTGSQPRPQHPDPLTINNTNIPSSMAIQDRPLRIRGAKRAVLLPADKALVPAQSASQRFIAAVPLVGWFLSGSSDLIGEGVPRKEIDGSFDSESAGLYWRFWYWVDWWCGSDYCGLRGDDE